MIACKKPKLCDYDKLNSYQELYNEVKYQENLKQQINELLLFDHIICKKLSSGKQLLINDQRKTKLYINIDINRNCSKINDKLKDLVLDDTFEEGKFIFKIIDTWKSEKSNDNHKFYLWLSNLTLQKFINILDHCNDDFDFK
jgi:hypothetical protein